MRKLLLTFLSLACFGRTAWAGGPFDDTLVQAPTLARPERGSIVGSLAQLAFGPADLSRGAFQLPSPMAAPGERGPLLARVFPTYSPDAGQTEWGLGWQADLSIKRYRELGEIDYANDEFTSPWGKLRRGDDGFYYPLGLASVVRVAYDPAGAGSWTALEPSGTTWSFRAADAVVTARGTYAWQLSEVATIEGERNQLEWTRNASRRPYLSKVRWGGRGSVRQYELELVYGTVLTPFDDYRSGELARLDRRVSEVRLSERHAGTGALVPRWRWTLAYTEGLTGPAFYLTDVRRVFASGESEPAVHYEYDVAGLLGEGSFLPLPELDPLLGAYGTSAISSEHAAYVDLDDDGVTELEHADSMTTWTRGPDGWSARELPPLTGREERLCRRDPGSANPPRSFLRLGPGAAPLRVLGARTQASQTRFVVCDTAGLPVGETTVAGSYAPGALVRLADLDHDLRPDLVRLNTGSVDVAMNTGTGDALAFAEVERQALTPRFAAQAAWVEDVNGDGVADLVGRGPNVFAVWLGLGHGTFVSDAARFSVIGLDNRRLSDLSPFSITWLDANKDGLLDLTLSYGRYVLLYTNDGYDFVQRDVAALRNLGFEPGLPLAVDLSGRGEAEIVVVRDRHAQALAFTAPSNGLLVRADDGKGTEVRFGWGRAEAGAGVGRRPTVLAELHVASVGQAEVAWYYDYGAPQLHSLGRFLLGFAHTRRVSALVTEDVELHHDDDVSGVVVGTTASDTRTPGAYRFSTRSFDERRFHGLRYWRLRSEQNGFRSYDGAAEISTLTEQVTYERELCPTVVRTTSRQGTLVRTTTLGHAALLPDELACTPVGQRLTGRHADATLDFDYAAAIDRDAYGAVTEVRSLGDGHPFLLQRVGYDAEHRIASVASSSGASTRATYEAGTGRLRWLESADGVKAEAALDPVTDAMQTLVQDRGGARWTASFGFDGQERLAASWDDVTGGSASAPAQAISYRYAAGTMPAAVRVKTRLSPTSTRETLTLSTAAGEGLAEATRVPEGWTFASLATHDPGERTALTYVRDATSADPATLDLAALFAGARQLGTAKLSGFDDPVFEEAQVQKDVTRTLSSTRRLVGAELVLAILENGTYLTRSGNDTSGHVIWREDQLGQRTTMTYDVLGRLVGVSLPGGDVHTLRFDAHGRPAEVRRASQGRIAYAYDPVTGRASEKRFYGVGGALERTVLTTRDALGRPVVETYLQPFAGGFRRVEFEYDGGPAATREPGELGLLTRVTGDGFEKRMRYRVDGHLLSSTFTLGSWRSIEESYSYLDDGAIASHDRRILDGQGHQVGRVLEERVYDATGRLAKVRFNGVEVASFVHDANGRLAAVELPDHHLISWRRDEVTAEVNGYTETGDGWVGGLDWSFDARALPARETYHFGGQDLVRSYSHDPRAFLSAVAGAGADASYEYGVDGLPAHTRDAAGDRVLTRAPRSLRAGDVEYELDHVGRVIRRGDLTLRYDAMGQIAQATRGARTWSYVYDEGAQRLLREENGRPVEAWIAGGYLTDEDFVLPVAVDGRVVGVIEAGAFRLLYTDARGTLLSEGEAPNIPTPFGVRAQHPRLAAAIDYMAKGWDADLGVVRMGVRDYDPLLGQFWSPDPLYLEAIDKVAADPVSGNLYSLGRNDPLRFADPTGNDPDGQHYIPQCITRALEKMNLNPEAAKVFYQNVTGWPKGVLAHGYNLAHAKYNEEVAKEFVKFATENKITDLAKMTKAEAQAFVESIKTSKNMYIRGFNAFQEAVQTAAGKMDTKEISAIWGGMQKWLTKSGGFGKFMLEEGGTLTRGAVGKALSGLKAGFGFLASAEADFALSFYNDVIHYNEMLKTHYPAPVGGSEKLFPIMYQWVPRDQDPPKNINWSEVPRTPTGSEADMRANGA
jgi:RHS repeat-associated protein